MFSSVCFAGTCVYLNLQPVVQLKRQWFYPLFLFSRVPSAGETNICFSLCLESFVGCMVPPPGSSCSNSINTHWVHQSRFSFRIALSKQQCSSVQKPSLGYSFRGGIFLPNFSIYLCIYGFLVLLTCFFTFVLQAILGAGHYVYADQPEDFNQKVKDICDSVD